MRLGTTWWNRFFWVSSVIVLSALAVGLDHYRRPPLLRGYGPDRRVYFTETLGKAEDLRRNGRYRIEPEAKWHLFRGWGEELQFGAIRRRAQVIFPSFGATALKVKMELIPLPSAGGTPERLMVELGVNGETITEVALRGREVVEIEVPSKLVHRGDNIAFLYRVTRRVEPGPWVALGNVEVVALAPE
jgi:hypothetical protein